ncbi:MAG: hypothetical protein KJ914_13540 [Gammaproteobacteria bacterium]|nr:hypothetical protein [Gammaproteobacteria bacterium]MBU1723787.1 hypothetical protein [Gammaproteobacteria bacterium]MBU2005448.1 hypothetical protein [Gammaproteobacteria bacterium]
MNEPTPTHPITVDTSAVSKYDESLLDSFSKDVAGQATRLDDLARQLITLNIAIPGLYATVLKFISGDKATLQEPLMLLIIFGAWLLALGFAFTSLYPEPYSVDPDSPSDIEQYFHHSARRKLKWLAAAGLFSFFGICFAVFSLFV